MEARRQASGVTSLIPQVAHFCFSIAHNAVFGRSSRPFSLAYCLQEKADKIRVDRYFRKPKMRRKTLGRYIVVDPEICHGRPTFRGTRIRVLQVLKQVAKGIDWDTIVWQWRGNVSRDAIAEAVGLAGDAFKEQNHFSSRNSRST